MAYHNLLHTLAITRLWGLQIYILRTGGGS